MCDFPIEVFLLDILLILNKEQNSPFQVWLPYFSHFHFSWKTKKKGPFFAKNEKKILPMKKGQNCIQLNKCYKFFNHLTGKISTQEFSSSFYHFLCWRQCGALEIYQKCPKIGKKWRKSIFCPPIFREKRKIEKNAKTKIFSFRWDP